jgi:hypothetical protein
MNKSSIFNRGLNLSESEIRRILSLHESAKKNHYLLENNTTQQVTSDQAKINVWYKLIDDSTNKEYRVKLTKIEPNFMVGDVYDTNNKNIGSGREIYFDKDNKMKFKINNASVSGSVYLFSQQTQTTTQQQNTTQQTTDKPKDIRGFQLWLNKNVPTWYNGGKLTKGFGIFGPKTSAAWSHYKDTYLKSGGK